MLHNCQSHPSTVTIALDLDASMSDDILDNMSLSDDEMLDSLADDMLMEMAEEEEQQQAATPAAAYFKNERGWKVSESFAQSGRSALENMLTT
ncbi:hypothetical protein ON010_g5165 [Phytophthora cinnamomi]|nr:hypothetical protein ON010_g5165 [Phytophthora cinnamomi]